MAGSNFKIGLEYLIPLIFILLIAGGPIQNFIFGEQATTLTTQEVPLLHTDKLAIPEKNLSCPSHSFETHILSTEPLVVYIAGFLSEDEADHMVKTSLPHYKPSTIWTAGEEALDESIRISEKALLPRDNIVKCVEERARAFQGWRPDVYVERLWSQRYGPGGHYTHHFDGGPGRISSFMVYLEANCTGGGTNFPRLRIQGEREKWCEFIECGSVSAEGEHGREQLEGVTFKPIKGNAVFWLNYAPDGRVYAEAWHAALPVTTGQKVGLNIWSWYQPGVRIKEASADV